MTVSDDIGSANAGSSQRHSRRLDLRTVLSNLLFGTRFVTIWIAMAVLLVVCKIIAPSTLSSASWASLLPLGSVVAIVALGQMLVIMMGGIDLSMAASISLMANVLVGVSKGSDDKLAEAILTVFLCGGRDRARERDRDRRARPQPADRHAGDRPDPLRHQHRVPRREPQQHDGARLARRLRVRQGVRHQQDVLVRRRAHARAGADPAIDHRSVGASRRSVPTGAQPGWRASASGST